MKNEDKEGQMWRKIRCTCTLPRSSQLGNHQNSGKPKSNAAKNF